MPTALPSDAAECHNLGPDESHAYNVCRDFEERATVSNNVRDIMHVRILGYLVLHSPSATARREVVKDILSCDDDYATLAALGLSFLNHCIRLFRKYKGKTPSPSFHPCRPSFDETKEAMSAEIEEAPRNHATAKQHALARDGYRCIVTGQYDSSPNSKRKRTATQEEVIAAGGACMTQCAHIIPDSTYFNVSKTTATEKAKRDYAASVLAVLQRFGYDVKNLNGKKVHSLHNVMTMENQPHDLFDRLELWFEATDILHCYNIRKTDNAFVRIRNQVTLTTPDASKYPLPSPQLLALHAASAKVSHLSGAGEYLDHIWQDPEMENISVLAHNGASDVLHRALVTLPQPTHVLQSIILWIILSLVWRPRRTLWTYLIKNRRNLALLASTAREPP